VGADLGGADGALEDAGDFGEGELLEAGEEEDLAILVVEAGEGGVQKSVIVAHGGMLAGEGGLVGVILQVGGIGGVRGGVAAAEVIRGAAAREVVHPRGEAAVVTIGVTVLQHPLKDDLGDVLGGGAVAGQLDEKAKERAVMAFEEFAERVEIAVADGEHQSMIGAWFGSWVHWKGGSAVSDGRVGMNRDFFDGGNHDGDETCGVAEENRSATLRLHDFSKYLRANEE
jgi:hypothetical protein